MNSVIGIVGGIGPEAGVDILNRLLRTDTHLPEQDRLPIILSNTPGTISDRTQFILGESSENPAVGIVAAIRSLHAAGALVIGVACHAAHAPSIWEVVRQNVQRMDIALVSMVDTLTTYLHERRLTDGLAAIGVWGTYVSNVYDDAFHEAGICALRIPERIAKRVHNLVWDPSYGIKYSGGDLPSESKDEFLRICSELSTMGVTVLVLACTELPLLLRRIDTADLPRDMLLIDANEVFAERLSAIARSGNI